MKDRCDQTDGHLLDGRVRYAQPRRGFRSGIEPVLLAAAIPARPGARVLDICCGTGDLMLALGKRSRGAVYGSDFCHPMLVAAQQKIERRGARSPLFEADALELPLADASLDLVTVAFGFRNLANYQRGLEQLLRILKPGGLLAILEFSTPPNPLLSRL